jgi:hypothetical protein
MKNQQDEWWWRKTKRTPDFIHHMERPAFLWELLRRTVEKKKHLPSWIGLPLYIQNSAMRALAPDPLGILGSPIRTAEYDWQNAALPMLEILELPGWSKREVISVNLRASDATLKAAFEDFISERRKKARVSKAPKNAGRSRKFYPWKYIELLDTEVLNGDTSLASMRSKAKTKLPKTLTRHEKKVMALARKRFLEWLIWRNKYLNRRTH